MLELLKQECEPNHDNAKLVDAADYSNLLLQLKNWMVKEDMCNKLVKSFSFDNFAITLSFVNKVAALAEEKNHHPKIICEWDKVTIEWWTHNIKGLHMNDFICAAKTEHIYNLLKD